jgi:hemerythrin-like domain-containing protein
MEEHRLIEKVLGALEAATEQDVPLDFYARALEFLSEFADGLHHAKEEEHLFPRMVEHGIPQEHGPIGVMLEEHADGREHIQAMRRQVAEGDVGALRREALAYCALLRDHIDKEDHVLFPMGRGVLAPKEMAEVLHMFEAVEAQVGPRRRWERLAQELALEVGAPA